MNFKFVVLFVVCASAASIIPNEELKELKELMKFKDDCTKEAGVDSEIVDEVFLNGGDTDDEKVKCVLACLNEKAGYVVNGEIDRAKLKAGDLPSFIPEEQKAELSELVIKCADITGANLCDTSYLINRCMFNKH